MLHGYDMQLLAMVVAAHSAHAVEGSTPVVMCHCLLHSLTWIADPQLEGYGSAIGACVQKHFAIG